MLYDYSKEFWIVFNLLPAEDREVLERYWRKGGSNAPSIISEDSLIDNSIFEVDSAATIGHTFFFRASRMDKVGVDCVHVVIAHELAHALILARNNKIFLDYTYDQFRMALDEVEADRIARLWGFDSQKEKIRSEVIALGSFRLLRQICSRRGKGNGVG